VLRTRLERMRGLAVGAGLSMMLALTGCGAFFSCEGKTSCGSSGGSGSTGAGDYVYVSNSSSGSTYINGYTIGTNSLTAVSGSPYQVNFVPIAMAITPNNGFLFVAAPIGTTYTGVWRFAINSSSGALSNATQVNSDEIGAMAISPDGEYLVEIDTNTGTIISEYVLDSSGGLTGPNTMTAPGSISGCPIVTATTPASATCAITFSPQGNLMALAENLGGTAIFPYSQSGGIASVYSQVIPILAGAAGDYSAAFDKSNNLYIANTSQLTPYTNVGSTSFTEGTGIPSGTTPRSVTLSTDNSSYVFTADEGSNQISSFSISGGTLTQLSTSPNLGPTNVAALGVDHSGTYLIAAGYNTTNGIQLLTISSTGVSPVASQPTAAISTPGTPIVMAVTH
jgi:6-phosphogluconolactonase